MAMRDASFSLVEGEFYEVMSLYAPERGSGETILAESTLPVIISESRCPIPALSLFCILSGFTFWMYRAFCMGLILRSCSDVTDSVVFITRSARSLNDVRGFVGDREPIEGERGELALWKNKQSN